MQHLWVHQRRDFVECATGQVALTEWCQKWIERIALIYHLNDERLKHHDPALERQTRAFKAAQRKLGKAVKRLFEDAEEELAALPDEDRRAKLLRSLLHHREGLCVFVDNPQVPMDNNAGERAIRGPAIGRRLSFGSNSEDGAKFAGAGSSPKRSRSTSTVASRAVHTGCRPLGPRQHADSTPKSIVQTALRG